MAANNSWTGVRDVGTSILVQSACCCDTEPTQNCSYLCYRSIATKREMIQFTLIPPDASHIFLMTSLFDINPVWNRKQVLIDGSNKYKQLELFIF